MEFESALCVFAHPDDAEFTISGTVAAWTKAGTQVHYLCITDGSAGSNEPGLTREEISEVRVTEQRAAADVLGVKSVTFLMFRDGELEVNLEARRAITRVVRKIRPDVLVGPDPSRLWSSNMRYINHSDHRAAGELVLKAVMPDAPTRPQFAELLDEGLEPFEVPNLWLGASEDGEHIVDITDTMDVKLAALACHASQLHDMDAAFERVRSWAEETGKEGGFTYGERFRTFAFKDR
jgi:LmbE family N-acetylglucosaminyl deacetylase